MDDPTAGLAESFDMTPASLIKPFLVPECLGIGSRSNHPEPQFPKLMVTFVHVIRGSKRNYVLLLESSLLL